MVTRASGAEPAQEGGAVVGGGQRDHAADAGGEVRRLSQHLPEDQPAHEVGHDVQPGVRRGLQKLPEPLLQGPGVGDRLAVRPPQEDPRRPPSPPLQSPPEPPKAALPQVEAVDAEDPVDGGRYGPLGGRTHERRPHPPRPYANHPWP